MVDLAYSYLVVLIKTKKFKSDNSEYAKIA